MSVFIIKGRKKDCNGLDDLYERLNYVTRATATDARYIYGTNVSTINAYAEMKAVKSCFGQMFGKTYFHHIIVPDKAEYVLADNLFIAGIYVTEYISHFSGIFQALMAIHFDKSPELHLHIVENNIDLITGKRLSIDRKNLAYLKQGISQILVNNGISPIRQKLMVDETGNWKNQEF